MKIRRSITQKQNDSRADGSRADSHHDQFRMNRNSMARTPFEIISAVFVLLAILGATLLPAQNSQAQVLFEEKTAVAGHFDDSESWGASWGNLNNDLWPDLFVVNHRFRPSLFRNNGDGTFTNMALQVDTSRTWHNFNLADTHGGSWADFDGDGDQDLSISTGTCCDSQLMVNDNGLFTDEAVAYGVEDDREGRLPVWLDYDNDGLLDLSFMSGSNARLYQNTTPTQPFPFTSPAAGIGNFCWRNNYAILSDIDGDDNMEYICVREGSFPMRTMDFDGGVFTDSTYLAPDMIGHGIDSAVGDFDGDLMPDILVTRGNLMPNQSEYIADANNVNTRVETWVTSGTGAGLRTITFKTAGTLTITAHSNQVGFPWKIFRGGAGLTLPNNPGTNQAKTTWTMDAANPDDHGLAYDYPGFDPDTAANRGTYAGYDPVEDLWTVTLVAGEQGSRAYYEVESTAVITDLDLEGDAFFDGPLAPALLMNTGSGFQNEVWTRGDIGQALRCVSAATADFDNDMDLDLYLVCRGGVENISNRLFLNDGNGDFTEIAAAGGAEGLVGKGLAAKTGTGENVTAADYDLDGYVDLFVTNGLIMQPFGIGAKDQLFRNTGTGNNWLEVELKGTVPNSNIEGIGAKILFTTDPGGANEKIQLRERNGGYHRWSQHHMRTHVGLAGNTAVDIEIRWPSGTVDIIPGVAANQIVEITEGGSLQTLTPGPAVGDPAPVSGDECGSPKYRGSEDTGIFLWKDCTLGEWKLELIGGDTTSTVQQVGSIVSNQPLLGINQISWESLDVLDNTIPEIIDFTMSVSSGGLDAFTFSETNGSNACLIIPASTTDIYLGAGHVRVQSPLNLIDPGAPCLLVSIGDLSVDENGGNANLTVTLSDVATGAVSVDVATTDLTAIDGSDYTATSSSVSFAAGETSKTVAIPILDDSLFESSESFEVSLTNASGAIIGTPTAEVTIIDDDAAAACGEPAYSAGVDKVLVVWKDCGTNDWHIRASAGGETGILHEGALLSTTAPSPVSPFNFESNDTLNVGPVAAFDYRMFMSGAGIDGIDFTAPAGTGLCLTTSNPAIPILVGSTGTVVTAPVDLESLGTCITGTLLDSTVDESDGTAQVILSLSSASTSAMSMDFSTLDGSATAGSDYTSTSNTVNIAAGATSANITIPILNDSQFESQESFLATASNASGFFLQDDFADVIIEDDDGGLSCGKPAFNPAVDKLLAVWQDCGTDQWHIEASAGGGTGINHSGIVSATAGLTNQTTVSFESNDSADFSDPQSIDYSMWMSGAGTDRIDFESAASTALCLTTDDPGITIKVGSAGTVVTSPVDLNSLGACLSVSVADVTTSENSGNVTLVATLSSAASSNVQLDVSTADGTAVDPGDYTASSQALTFTSGQTTQNIVIPIVDDSAFESDEDFSVTLSNATGAFIIDNSATVTITDDDGSASCGEPAYTPATDKVMAVWQDCSTNIWYIRATAGGQTSIQHNGTLVASSNLTSVTGVSLESNDTVDTSNLSSIAFDLWMSNAGEDGIDFTASAGTSLCLTTNDPTISVILGASGTAVTTPVDLATGASCSTLSVGNVSVDEDAGTVNVPITLSAPAASDVTVDVTATDGTAVSGSDYTANNQSVSILTGQTSTNASFPIIDDASFEPDEIFLVDLSNANGAQIANASGQVTILDDDSTAACGMPAIDAAVDKALFVWKDCGTELWHFRATGGGGTGIQHEGTITLTNGSYPSTPPYTPYSMEGVDTVTIDSTNTVATFLWRMSGNGVDGMEIDTTSGANLCLDTLDPSLPILLGAGRTSVTAPVDLFTQGACQ